MSALIGRVPDDWQEMPLVNMCQVVAGPSSSMIRPVEAGGVPIDIVAPKHLQYGRIAGSSTALVTAEASARLDRYRLVPGDLVFVRTGDLGKQALAGPEHDGWVAGTSCFRLRPEPTIDPRYLLHYLSHPALRDWIARHASTATVPTLTLGTLRTLPVLVPLPAVQSTIGDIMGALDDKVALHREIVEVVTALAAALRHLPGLRHRDWDTIAGRLAARGADRSGLTSALSLQCPGPRRPRAGRCGRQHRGDPPAAVGAGGEVPVPAERADQP